MATSAQTALKYEVEVNQNGQVELTVPFAQGARVTVFVLETRESFSDLMTATESTLDFWNNALDDEDWNNA